MLCLIIFFITKALKIYNYNANDLEETSKGVKLISVVADNT